MSGSRLIAALSPAAQREVTPFERFRAQMNAVRRDVASMIGDKKVDSFIRIVLNAVQRDPKLLLADRKSLMLASLEAAQDGLMPDGTEAVFNIYGTKFKEGNPPREVWRDIVQYLPMAYGLVQLIYQSGATKVDAVAVYEKDVFEYERGDVPRIKHVPYTGEEDPGKVVAAYCVVEYANMAPKREVMFRRDIEKVRKKSKSPNGLMWKEGEEGFYDQGAIKSVIHRIWKQLPKAEALRRALAHDNKSIGLAEVAVNVDDSGANLESIVESNVVLVEDLSGKDVVVPTGKIAEPTAAGAAEPAGEAAAVNGVGSTGSAAGEQKSAPSGDGLPKPGDPGTPEMKARFVEQLSKCTDPDALDLKMDDVRLFKWSDADLAEMTDVYNAQKGKIGPNASTRRRG